MDFAKQFQSLKLECESNPEAPFLPTARLKEDATGCLYGCACNQYLPAEAEQAVATVGSRHIHVYTLPGDFKMLKPHFSVTLDVKDEDLYTVTWCFDTYDSKEGRDPYKIVTGGSLGQLYIIDASSGNLCNSNETPGGAVNDLRTCPTNSNLVACGTKDATVKIFHIRNEACLVVMGGPDGHLDQVLSVDWTANGKYILSCGFDHQVMKWDMSSEHVMKHLEAACKALESGERDLLTQKKPLQIPRGRRSPPKKQPRMSSIQQNNQPSTSQAQEATDKYAEITENPVGCLMTIFEPTDVCNDLHTDYVDCVRTLGSTIYNLSKASGAESSISLWRFGAPKGVETKESAKKPRTSQTSLGKWSIEKGDKWFVKFGIDTELRWIACGEDEGYISFYDLKTPGAQPTMRVKVGENIVRQVSFSSDGRIMVAITEKAEVFRFDRKIN